MHLDPNPYAASAIDETAPLVKGSGSEPTARDVFLAWEKLRVIYNVILAALSVLLGLPHLATVDFWFLLLLGALIANVCFCLGWVLEGYAALVGINRQGMRLVLFVIGTFLAAGLAVLSIAGSY